MRLKNKTVLVTGASKGIGATLAIGCAREGADVILNYNTDRDGAEQTASEIEKLGRKTLLIGADIAKVSEIDKMFQKARETFSSLDVLINNAGVTGWGSAFDTTEEKWDMVLDTNLKGPFFCSVRAAEWMREKRTKGTIVNVSTNCAALGVKNLVAYATSKAGLHGLTMQLAVEFGEDGIRVNTFAPGPTNVERNLRDDPNYREVWGSVVPLGRTADPEEMTGPAIFLASEESSFVTGQVFYADGGWSSSGSVPKEYMDLTAKKNR